MPTQQVAPFSLAVECSEFAVRQAVCAVREALLPLDLNTDDLGNVEIVLAEVLNNIVEHAYARSDMDSRINLRCSLKDESLHICITDRGLAMPGGKVPFCEPHVLNVETADLPEGGFGWTLIRKLAKDIRYSRKNGQNQLCLRLAVGLQA